ncbi:hypothetical protein KAX02_00705 [candidate division WOR-3 bacterium]|nr:hypothetical protein [candidate division WOR-3 bacterium]
MADPNPSIYNAADDTEITAINYGTGDAGAYKPSSAGTEYHIWNDKGKVLTSSPMTSVKVTVRDSDGQWVENVTVQKWVEVKSTTIHAGADGGSISGYTDDNMADFQAVGKDGYANFGDIPCDCYRKVFIRVNIPTSALEAGVTFKIYVTNQEAYSSIAKYHTGLHGNGIVYNSAGALKVTDNAGANSVVDIEKGFALISDGELYYGSGQTYTLSTDAGVYKVYLTSAGVISSTTGSIPSNAILLSWVTIAGSVVTDVVDKRDFIMQRVISQHFQDLLAADTDGIHAAITGNGAIQNITTAITNPDYARNGSITVTNVATPSGDVKLVGIVMGKNDEESITIIPGSTACGNKPFDLISKIVIPAGVSASDTVTVGFSDKIGLDNPIVLAADVFKKKVNNEDKTSELSTKVSTTYHTVDCATVVANEDMLLKYKSILTI